MPNPTDPSHWRRRAPLQRHTQAALDGDAATATQGVVLYLESRRTAGTGSAARSAQLTQRASRSSGGLSPEARMRHRVVLNMAAAARETRALQPAVRVAARSRGHFWQECAAGIIVVLGVLGMFGFIAAQLGLASGRLDWQGYLGLSLGSLLNYGSALLMVWFTRRTGSARAAPLR